MTNQDSAGRKSNEIRQLFSMEMALNMYEKGFTISRAKSEKYEPFCVSKLQSHLKGK